MIRTISLAVLAAVALSACVSSGYAYRGGGVGDYYSGRSSQSYYRGGVSYGSAAYGSVPYGSVGYGYPGGVYGSIGYGYPSYYGGGYYGRPGYGYYGPYYPPYYRPYVRARHPHRHGGKRPHHGKPPNPYRVVQPGPDGDDPPWRNLNRLRDGVPRDPRAVPSGPATIVQRPMVGTSGGLAPRIATPPRLESRLPQVRANTTPPPGPTRRLRVSEDRDTP